MNHNMRRTGSWALIMAAGALSLAMLATRPLDAQAFRFVTTCDAQGNSDASPNPGASFGYVVSRISALSPAPDFWIFGGDAYYSATDSATAMAHWQTWMSDIAPIADIPVYAAIGNHDINNYGHFYGSGWHGDGTGPFRATWSGLPQNGPTGYIGTAYSFRYGNSIFCVVNTNIYNAANYTATFKVDATQRSWLAAVLDTTTAVHKFVIGHCEAYPPSDTANNSSSLEWNVSDRNAFWTVMTSHNVEAYICGHIHLWNRDYFVASGFGNAPANTTTRQVICGGAGGGLVGGYGGNFYHFVVWDVNGASVTARVIDSYGAQRDSFGWSTPSGVAVEAAAASGRPACRIRYYHGAIQWDGGAQRAVVSVYDIDGRRVWSAEASGGRARWAGAANGVYLVRVAQDGGRDPGQTGKIIILH